MTSKSEQVAVVCIGNSLVADDAAGCAVHEQLETHALSSDVHLHHLGVGGMNLLDILDGEAYLIVVDAANFGKPPGTIHVREWDELPGRTVQPVSAHGIGIRDVIETGRAIFPERMPRNVLLIGIEGRCFDSFVTQMSPEVQLGVTRAVDEVIRRIAIITDPGQQDLAMNGEPTGDIRYE